MTLSNHIRQLIESELSMVPPIKCEGWTEPSVGVEMAELVLKAQPSVIIEIGCFGARSTLAMALALRELGRGKIITIDPWKKEAAMEGECQANQEWWATVNLSDIHTKAMEAVWRNQLDEYVCVIRGYSQYVHGVIGNCQMIFLDGNHSEVASCRDVEYYAPKLDAGGYLWFDDANWGSTQKALDMLSKRFSLVKNEGKYRIYRNERE